MIFARNLHYPPFISFKMGFSIFFHGFVSHNQRVNIQSNGKHHETLPIAQSPGTFRSAKSPWFKPKAVSTEARSFPVTACYGSCNRNGDWSRKNMGTLHDFIWFDCQKIIEQCYLKWIHVIYPSKNGKVKTEPHWFNTARRCLKLWFQYVSPPQKET